ncbi:hypothetical protein Asppvi_010354 [Aspergillus pseudoviridinutans]|uniref:Ankyrin repeat-containing domain protein n=1 Tax=Aspergillus pseudoviridinutans TaxID=1517512 RepID=A0A9P3EWZ1_9EURO|nr:uncharacterized protein Asppvi_010354 [Aspergillus pseudoviridinutans]GIJ91389.1 hypothetical protein Asppvi_010354 [Aspergillus pseudoviridinutans]
MRYLIGAGVPVSMGRYGTFLDFFVGKAGTTQSSYGLISELIDAGGYITDNAVTPINQGAIRFIISHHPEVRQALADVKAVFLSPLARLLIQGDEDGLANLVARRQLTGTHLIGNWSALELAIDWPAGVKILLGITDVIPRDVIYSAIGANCLGSLSLLLEAGVPFHADHIAYSVRYASDKVTDLLVDELIVRRKRLRDFAMSTLPEHVCRDLGLTNHSLPDLNAFKVYETLQRKGIIRERRLDPWRARPYIRGPDSQPKLEDHYDSVFHQVGLSCQVMQKLYDAGLTDIDTPDTDGRTPLMCTTEALSLGPFLDRARWLISKGANPNRLLPGTATPTMHKIVSTSMVLIQDLAFVASKGVIPQYVDIQLACIDRENRAFLIKAITENKHDGCRCACSKDGCTPLSVTLRNLARTSLGNSAELALHIALNLLQLVPPSSDVAETFIRLMTFEDLDLAHTCCDWDDEAESVQFRQDPDVIEKEQEEAIHAFEELVQGFMDQYNRLGLPLVEFLRQHWCVRMQDYLQGQTPSDEELGQIKELGVEILPGLPFTSNSWCVLMQPKITEIVNT